MHFSYHLDIATSFLLTKLNLCQCLANTHTSNLRQQVQNTLLFEGDVEYHWEYPTHQFCNQVQLHRTGLQLAQAAMKLLYCNINVPVYNNKSLYCLCLIS